MRLIFGAAFLSTNYRQLVAAIARVCRLAACHRVRRVRCLQRSHGLRDRVWIVGISNSPDAVPEGASRARGSERCRSLILGIEIGITGCTYRTRCTRHLRHLHKPHRPREPGQHRSSGNRETPAWTMHRRLDSIALLHDDPCQLRARRNSSVCTAPSIAPAPQCWHLRVTARVSARVIRVTGLGYWPNSC